MSAATQTLVQTVALFFVYRHLIQHLGVERLGVWGIVLATTSVARVSELGLSGSVTKFVSTYGARGDVRAAREAIQTAAISIGAILGVVLPLLYTGLVPALTHLLPPAAGQDAIAVLPYALASLWFTAVAGVWLGALDGRLRSDLRAALVIAATLVFMVLALVVVRAYGLVGLAVAQVVQGLILAVGGWVMVRRVMTPMPIVPTHWNRARFREMLGYGINIQIMAVVMLIFEPMTKILFARYDGLAASGYFELAQQPVMKARALIVESNRVIVPVIAGMEGTRSDARQFYSRNVRYLFCLLTPMFAGLAASMPAISELWIGHYERQFVTIAISLTLAWYINSLAAPSYFAYLGEGKLRWVTGAHVALGVANAALGLTLGPLLGWQGVTLAFVASLALGSLLPVWTYHREHALGVQDILSKSDWLLAGFCLAAAAATLTMYSWMLLTDASLSTRIALVAAAGTALLAATAWHPLTGEMLGRLRRARTGRDNGAG